MTAALQSPGFRHPARIAEAPDEARTPTRREPTRPLRHGAAIGPLVLLAAWSIASATGWHDPRVHYAPWTVIATARNLLVEGRLERHLLMSGQRAVVGFGMGLVVGTLLALVSGLTRAGQALIDGTIQIKRAIPTVALIPLLILWLGIGEPMKVATIALTVLFPVYIHTHAALRTIDVRYFELAKALRLTRWQFIRRVALPGALPGFLLGARLAVTDRDHRGRSRRLRAPGAHVRHRRSDHRRKVLSWRRVGA